MKITLKPLGVQTAVVFGASSGADGLKTLVAEIEAAGGENAERRRRRRKRLSKPSVKQTI